MKYLPNPVLALVLIVSSMASLAQEAPRVLILGGTDESQMTIGQLKPAYIDFSYRANPRIAVPEIVSRYVKLLKEAEDPEVRLKALQRLGALENLYGETVEDVLDRQAISEAAIRTYEQHLAEHPRAEGNDWVLYQLARSYEMAGRPQDVQRALERLMGQFPRSKLVAESAFRIGEIRFANGQFADAEKVFRETLKHPEGGPFRLSAEYMLGWALFRQQRMDASMDTFISVLGKLQKQAEQDIRTELRDDVLRIMSVIAGYQEGTDTLFAALERNRASQLAPLVYESHYQFYLSTDRYQDAADVASHYIDKYPMSAGRIRFHDYRIQAYHKGNLPTLVRQEKERVVAELGVGSAYYRRQSGAGLETLDQTLATYLDELGRYEYALASKLEPAQALDHWKRSEHYFSELLKVKPADANYATDYLLLGEVRLKLGDWRGAIPVYRQAGYEFTEFPQRIEAAYAAVAAYPEFGSLPPEDQKALAEELERFALTYPADKRAGTVLLAAAQSQLALGNQARARDLSGRLLGMPLQDVPDASPVVYSSSAAEKLSSRIVLGHSEFALGNYARAEAAYREARKSLKAGDDRAAAVEDNLAASLYRQGEQKQAEGDLVAAQDFYLQVVEELPRSVVAEVALYDAAMRAIDLERWLQSSLLLEKHRSTYPERASERGIDQKLVFSYERGGQFASAAAILLTMRSELDPEASRQALFQAVELYEQADQPKDALRAAEDYVEQYKRPFDSWIAMHQRLVDLNEASGNRNEPNVWRQRLIAAEATGGSERTAETRTLAAAASWALIEPKIADYEKISLVLPLQKSLSRKSEALKALMANLQKVNQYGVQEYVTRATDAMGRAYRQLSQALLASQRPKGLSELEEEQYVILLEEQAFPFEEKAIELYEANAVRTAQGVYDASVASSIHALAEMMPARYDKPEREPSWAGGIN